MRLFWGIRPVSYTHLDVYKRQTESGPGDRADAGVSARYLAMRLGGRAEDTETSEIEIEQIRRGVDAAKSPVHLEVVSLERLLEATAQYDLEDITPEAVLAALADHRLVFLAGDRGGLGTRCLEVIGGEVTVLYQCCLLYTSRCV